MGVERISEIVKQEIFYQRPETVGTAQVLNVDPDEIEPDLFCVTLSFDGTLDEDESPFIYSVPTGLISEGQIVEVVIRKPRWPSIPPECRVAIRPFDKFIYGKFYSEDERTFYKMFNVNRMDSETCPRFFKKFLTKGRQDINENF